MTEINTQVVVLGSGPGGYSAAFRAADLGFDVTLVERYEDLGGVCLNVGCIPSKALLHLAKVIDDTADMAQFGIDYAGLRFDAVKVRAYKDSVVKKLTGGLKIMAKQRNVQIVTGTGKFVSPTALDVVNGDVTTRLNFHSCIIAVGSLPVKLPFIPDDPRVIDSTGALQLENPQCNLLVLGGGIIGLEMATVYHALGSKISIVEMMDQIIPGADADLVKPLHNRIEKRYESIMLKTRVTAVEARKDALWVTFEGENVPEQNPKPFDRILVSVGRRPNGKLIGAENAGVQVDERGFISVDKQLKTNVPNIYAIGDVIGNPMLAHKASAEGRLAAEVIAGMKHFFDPRCIPSVAYTDPEIAWTGMTEREAIEKGIEFDKGVFPWMASGRALSLDRSEGFTKVLFDKKGTVIGGGITGVNAGELISEISLAVEMGCDAEDLALTIHPHPTLSESVMMATEVYEGTITDLLLPKQKNPKKREL